MYQNNLPVKDKLCKNCGNPFTPYMTTDRYCSPKCAMTAGVGKAIKRSAILQSTAPAKSKPKPKTKQEPSRRKRMKTAAKKRDNYQCRLYGVDGHTCDFRREAHHIVYVSQFKDLEGDELWNLITLCGYAHHQIAHANKKYWQHRLLAVVNGEDWYTKIDQSAMSDSMVKILRHLENKRRTVSGEQPVGVV